MPFAAVCCCFLRCVAACTFCYLSSPKMVPKCSPEASKHLQNRPKIDPKLTQNCPLAHPGAPRWNQNPILSFWDRFWSPIWSPLGPKIDQKSIPCEKNAPRSALSKQCLTGAVHHLIFYILFWSFLVEKRWKKHHVVVLLAGISRPWKTMYFTGYPAWGQCFCKFAEILKI